MNFFQSHESLTTMEWTLRAVLTFIFMVIAAKSMGQRAISQLRLLDFVVALMLGNIIAHPLSDPTIGMKGSIITTIVIVMLYIMGVLLNLKWGGIRKLFESAPFPLIKDGQIIYKGLKKARISIDYLLAELRKDKVVDIKKVALALWESDGKLSIFLDPSHEAITPSYYKFKTEPFDYPKTIIKEGKINLITLKEINLSETWLIEMLKSRHQTKLENILLATIDNNKNLNIFLYN